MKQFLVRLFIPIIAVIGISFLHFTPYADTMLNCWNPEQREVMQQIDEHALEEAIDYHKQEPAFARRPLTTFLIEQTSNVFKIERGTSFILINLSLFFLCGIVLFYACVSTGSSITEALFSQFIFYAGFSILFAFFNTNYTYDEPLTYLFFLLSLIFFRRMNFILFSVFFLMAAISRESVYLFIPAFIYSIIKTGFSGRRLLGFSAALLLIIILHAIVLKFVYPPFYTGQGIVELHSRFTLLQFNFQDSQYTIETISSFFLIMLFPLFLLFRHRVYIHQQNELNQTVRAFFLIFILNTFIVLTSAYARESRLFALPLLWIFPLLGQLLARDWELVKSIKSLNFRTLKWPVLLIQLLILMLAYYYCYFMYRTTIQLPETTFNRGYLFLIILLCIILSWLPQKKGEIISADPDIYKQETEMTS